MKGVIRIVGWVATLGMHQNTGGGRGRGITFAVLRALWHMTFEPVYRWLFRAHFDAIAGRLEEIAGELSVYDASLRNQSAALSDYGVELRTHVHGLNVRLEELAARVAALDERVRTVIAGQWEQEAIARRMAVLEDRIQADGSEKLPGAP
jgi:hypothetical protein